jgi:hypothetical protein
VIPVVRTPSNTHAKEEDVEIHDGIEDFERHHHHEIPENSLFNAHVCVDQYFDGEDGGLKFAAHYAGDVPLSQLLGLLEIAKDAVKSGSEDW